MDGLMVVGEPKDVWAALLIKEEVVRRQRNLTRHLTKPSVYSPSGNHGHMPEGFQVGTNGGGDTALPLGYGVVVAGIPIGDEIFKRNRVALEMRRVCGVIDSTLPLLRTSHDSCDHAHQINCLSLPHLLGFSSQVTPASNGVIRFPGNADDRRL